MSQRSQPRLDMLVQRQLDNINTGNCAYLETFLKVIKQAGFRIRIVFAPSHSFGNRPWTRIHPRLAALIDEVVWPGSLQVGDHYWSYSPRVWGRFMTRAGKALANSLGASIPIPSYLGRPMIESDEQMIAGVSNRDPGSITIAEYSSMGPVLKRLTSGTRRGIMMHDLLSDRGRIWRENGSTPDLYEVSFEEEVDWCRAAELMFYASANELEKLQAALPEAQAVWLRPEPPEYGETRVSGKPRVLFLGTTHAGNTDAIKHFLHDIWPMVIKKVPDLEVWIAGSVGNTLSEQEKAITGVKVLGRVQRLESIGGNDSIGIAPTRYATGISIKVAEYLMLDMTCVAYPLAVEGFKSALNDLVVLKASKEEFASSVVALVRDHQKRVQQATISREKAREILNNREVTHLLREALAVSDKRIEQSFTSGQRAYS